MDVTVTWIKGIIRIFKSWKEKNEYSPAAEPPVRCGVSHVSGLTEPPCY